MCGPLQPLWTSSKANLQRYKEGEISCHIRKALKTITKPDGNLSHQSDPLPPILELHHNLIILLDRYSHLVDSLNGGGIEDPSPKTLCEKNSNEIPHFLSLFLFNSSLDFWLYTFSFNQKSGGN